MVASDDPLASKVGAEVMKQGGDTNTIAVVDGIRIGSVVRELLDNAELAKADGSWAARNRSLELVGREIGCERRFTHYRNSPVDHDHWL